jgi:Flp pilus assembly protein TadD
VSARRLPVLFALLLCFAQPLAAQGRAGMAIPGLDMSNAPPDIQAIMKKVMSGGIPTQDEAKRLADYMSANKGAIARGATAYGDSMKKKATVAKASLSAAADQNACPAHAPVPASLASAPSSTSKLLDSIRQSFAAKVDAKTLAQLQSALAKVSDAGGLNELAGGFLLSGYDDLAILTYVAEVTRAASGSAQAAWADLGAALIGVNQPMAAIPVLRHALALGPRVALFVTDLGVAYADLGDFATATTILQEAIRLAPSDGQAYDALSRVQSCEGNLALAAHTMDQAQDVDWSENRQKTIAQAEKDAGKSASSSNDDAEDAQRPLPMPPGKSPFPPPPGGDRPSNFAALAPKISDSYGESVAAFQYNASMIASYQDLARQVMSTSLGKPTTRSTSRSSAAGLTVVYSISNGHQAIAALGDVKRRTAARMAMMRTAFHDKANAIRSDYAERAGAIENDYHKCDDKKTDCFRRYCSQMKPLVTASYAALAGNARTFIGGIDGLSQKFSTSVNAWFVWAGDPESRKVIDIQRRYYLAEFQVEAFGAASETVMNTPDGCEKALAQRPRGTGKLDDPEDPGPCTSRAIKIPKFANMEADCHEMKMSVDYFSVLGGTPTVDIRRATRDKYGKFFLGLNWSDEPGIGSGSLGIEVTWDNQGWIKGAGPAATAEASSFGMSASGDAMLNVRSSGPLLQGQAGASASLGPMTFAPSTSFGGKY